MRFNKIMFLGLLLMAVLAVGAVSASEDVAGDQNLTLADESSDVLEESVNEEPEILEYYQVMEDDVFVTIYETYSLGSDDDELAVVHDFNDGGINGSISVEIDGNRVFFENYSQKDDSKYLTAKILNNLPGLGTHLVEVTYQKNGIPNPFIVSGNVEFVPFYEVIVDDDLNRQSTTIFQYGGKELIYVWYPNDADAYFDFIMDGKSIGFNRYGVIYIDPNSLKLGDHVLEIKFKDKSGKYPSRSDKVSVLVQPGFYCPHIMSVGEGNHILLKTPKKIKIKAILYKKDRKTKLCTVSGEKALKIDLKKYVKKGDNEFYLVARFGDYKFKENIYIEGIKNSPKLKVNVKKLDDRVKLTLKGPKYYEIDLIIVMDDKYYYYGGLDFHKGYHKEVLKKSLSVGKHKIKVVFLDSKYKFSKTFTVKVKAKDKVSISLNKVKIKKSAKKVVLRSTVKLNKKAKKGLKVTFKFNGKKFTAKTNSKGVAKLTVKSKYYKNLEVGKKTKIQATYSHTSTKWGADVIE